LRSPLPGGCAWHADQDSDVCSYTDRMTIYSAKAACSGAAYGETPGVIVERLEYVGRSGWAVRGVAARSEPVDWPRWDPAEADAVLESLGWRRVQRVGQWRRLALRRSVAKRSLALLKSLQRLAHRGLAVMLEELPQCRRGVGRADLQERVQRRLPGCLAGLEMGQVAGDRARRRLGLEVRRLTLAAGGHSASLRPTHRVGY
jgi:hypothetical protein